MRLTIILQTPANKLKIREFFVNNLQDSTQTTAVAMTQKTSGQRLLEWIEEPLGQIVTASVATIGSFGVVMSGIWFVNTLVN